MTGGEGSGVHRHPDAVAYPEGLGEEGAAMVRPYEGGHTRCWVEGGEVRSRHVANLAGLDASPGSLRRWSLALGEEAPRSGREKVAESRPLEPRIYLFIDRTGIPMRGEEVSGVACRQEDGTSKTR